MEASAGAARTAYFEAAAMAEMGNATFRIDHYDPDSGKFVPAYATALPSGWWAIYSRVAAAQEVCGLNYRAAVQGGYAHFVQKFRRVPTYLQTAGMFPRSWSGDGDFSNDVDGVTHDETTWYFSRSEQAMTHPLSWHPVWGQLARAPVGANIEDESQWDPSMPHEPDPWRATGLVHYGDITFARDRKTDIGHIFVPIEGDLDSSYGFGIGVFNTLLQPLGLVRISGRSGCAWIAFNPRDQLFYVPAPDKPNGTLARFDITVAADAQVTESRTTSVTVVRVLARRRSE